MGFGRELAKAGLPDGGDAGEMDGAIPWETAVEAAGAEAPTSNWAISRALEMDPGTSTEGGVLSRSGGKVASVDLPPSQLPWSPSPMLRGSWEGGWEAIGA